MRSDIAENYSSLGFSSPLHSFCVANSLTCLQAKEYRTRFPFPHRIQALFRTNSQHPSLLLSSPLLSSSLLSEPAVPNQSEHEVAGSSGMLHCSTEGLAQTANPGIS